MKGFEIPNFNLGKLAQITGGELVGDPRLELYGVSSNPLEADEKQLCLVFTPRFLKLLNQGELKAGAYLVPSDVKIERQVAHVKVPRPKLVIKQLLDFFGPKRFCFSEGVHPTAIIAENVKLGAGVSIAPHCYIGPGTQIGDQTQIQPGVVLGKNVQIGTKCLIRAKVVIEDETKIGDRVIIHPGAVIGADGFSYVTERPSNAELLQQHAGNKTKADLKAESNPLLKVPSIGWVEIGDDVEIGANTCIDRGTIGATVIKRGTKIDNLVQIAHNCLIGEECVIIGQAGLAGSVTLGDRVLIAGHSGCRDNIELGHDTVLVGASHAHRDAPPFSLLGSNPAIEGTEYLKREKTLRRIMREFPILKEQIEKILNKK
ncbi:MAG: UDP-3-O-(3-hydroxymyristoyl)glucosamine N-acyltransferase [Candidatus Caenarcaniphilales bacterium]|nr:UDP-3-O-(3-hydroxymyristoyl)glucosamine N-acyltransferase [Candidatus Caenarcaniphilales bacterium]